MRCYACKKIKFLLSKGPLIGSPLLFVCGAMHVKKTKVLLSKEPSIGSPLLFIRGATRVKSISFYCLDWRVPSICVTKLGVPNLERDRLSV
jgi:hypothetical protein